MRKVILFGLLLFMGVATAFGQQSAVQVFGVPFGSTYEGTPQNISVDPARSVA